MTEQEINIAIAKHFDYIEPHYNEFGTLIAACFRNKEGKPIGMKGVPQWTKCLNEMHRAWQTLTLAQKRKFETELYKVIIGDGDYNRNDDAMNITNATSRHRAEAFLRTLGLWED